MTIVIFALIIVGLILICIICAVLDENSSFLHPVWAGEMLLGRVRFDKKIISAKPVNVLKGEDNLKASPKDYFSVYIAGGNILFSGKIGQINIFKNYTIISVRPCVGESEQRLIFNGFWEAWGSKEAFTPYSSSSSIPPISRLLL